MRKKEVSYSKKTIVRLIWTGILVAGVIILTMGTACFAGRLSMKVKAGLLVFDCILFAVYFAEVYRDMYRPWCELEKIVHERKDRKTETLADANIAQRDLIKEIQEIIPHRHPFLLVDCVEELEPGVRAVGYKSVTYNEPYFAGHFPQEPVMPGVLIVEALAQTGAVAILSVEGNKGKTAYFGAMNNVKFKKKVVPGDKLRLECEIIKQKGPVGVGKAVATVDGKVAVSAELTFMIG